MNHLLMLSTGMWGTILDIAIISIFATFIIIGFIQGFFKSLLKLLSTVGALSVAIFCSKPLLTFFNSIFTFSESIGRLVLSILKAQASIFNSQITTENVAQISDISIFTPLKNYIIEILNGILDNGKASEYTSIGDALQVPIGNIFAVIIIGILLFTIVKMTVNILSKIFEAKEYENGGKNSIDRLLGLFVGAFKGILCICVIYLIISISSSISIVDKTCTEIINESKITRPTYTLFKDTLNNELSKQAHNILNGLK